MAKTHRLRRIVALAFVITGLAAVFQPTVASGSVGTAISASTHTVSMASQRARTAADASFDTLAAGTAADDAIELITAPSTPSDVLKHIPPDFSKVMGYTPTVGHLANGTTIAINPRGGCSVIGGGRPFDLDVACKAHDLGYDLLRYAHRRGADLGPQARHLVDDKFGADLYAQCTTLYSGSRADACDVMAASFDAAVGFNSWRQQFGAPVAAAGTMRTIGVVGLGLILVYFMLRSLLRATTRTVVRTMRRLRTGQLGLDVAAA